jgi:hypothetical protein
MAKKKIEVVEEKVVVGTPVIATKTEKELLTECYEFMKSRGMNSIGDLEGKIARL